MDHNYPNYNREYPYINNISVIKIGPIRLIYTLFYKELSNIKQTLINHGFPNYTVDKQIKLTLAKIGNMNMNIKIQ